MFDEALEDVWRQKYGASPPAEAPDLGRFLTHRSIRHFTDEPIPESTIESLIGAAQSASTSSNLQLWTMISVQEAKRRERIAELCANQNQIRSAAWFLGCFVDHYRIQQAAIAVGEDPVGLDFEEFYVMGIIDVALAAERMVCAAESIGIGCCYIGALRNDVQGVQAFFNLPKGTFGAFGLCLGWPAEPLREHIKPKLSQSAVWHRETYDSEVRAEVAEYDNRMKAHFAERGMSGDVGWSARMGRRIDGSAKSMTGREALHEWVRGQGFSQR